MRTKLLLFFIVTIILYSCHQEQGMVSNRYPGIGLMIDGYYQHFYEYPKSLDSLITEMEFRKPYVDSSFSSCYETTLNNLKKDKSSIRWYLFEDDFLNEKLIVLRDKDTIIQRINSFRFPCLGLLLMGYKNCYYDYPSTLDELLEYINIVGYVNEYPFKGCDSVTINNLINGQNKKLLRWKKDENGLFISVNNDTIGFFPPFSPCELSPFDKRYIHFFDTNKNIVLSDQMETNFKKGICLIQMDFPVVIEEEKGNYHILQYQDDCGLKLYCENDYLPQDTQWFTAINSFVRQFAIDNNLDEIIFGVVYCSKK